MLWEGWEWCEGGGHWLSEKEKVREGETGDREREDDGRQDELRQGGRQDLQLCI